MLDVIKAFLSKNVPSWTVWLGILWAVLSGLPDVMVAVVGWFGPVTPELTAKVVAVTMMLARIRSSIAPLVMGLLGKSE